MTTAIITTTINVPTNLRAWTTELTMDDVVVVAGDYKTPHDDVRALLNELPCHTQYLEPDDQMKWAISAPTGWNCIQRRNIALLEALRYAPDVIITIDDDNYPVNPTMHVSRLRQLLTTDTFNTLVTRSDTGWYNAASALSPPVVHRGFPLSRRHEIPDDVFTTREDVRFGVAASLWLGDPDIDAIERICHDPEVYDIITPNITLDLHTWCPFNTQAVALRAKLAPLLMVWPGVGRYDDIWASYLARRVMDHLGWYVRYGEPLVRQERNPHNLVRDLRDEMFGYEHTDELTEVLRAVDFGDAQDVMSCLNACYDDLARWGRLPLRTLDAFAAWQKDLEMLMNTEGVTF